jgi:hypothetical protein
VPEQFPLNLKGFNKSSTELYLEWQPLDERLWNGVALGYKIFYISPDANNDYWSTTTVGAHTNFKTLDQLSKYTRYKIKVAAFTSKGIGPVSPVIFLQTSEDGKI